MVRSKELEIVDIKMTNEGKNVMTEGFFGRGYGRWNMVKMPIKMFLAPLRILTDKKGWKKFGK
jgi:hypothetical protein